MSRLKSDLLDYQSKYVYSNGTLINKLDITDANDLDVAERTITTRRLAQLFLQPIPERFNANHYLAIHKYLFQDIYDWAGEIRGENISKRVPFCPPQNVYSELNRVLSAANAMVPRINSKERLLTFITELYSDLDIIHPFREGNGRTLREFTREYISYICKYNGLEPYYFDYSSLDKDRYVDAVVKADALLDYSDLLGIFTEIIKVREDDKIK